MRKFFYFSALVLTLFQCSPDPEREPVPTPEPEVTAEVTLKQKWIASDLKTPESVLYEEESEQIFVSNINNFNLSEKDGDGFISTLSLDGSVKDLKWISGLNDPKGMGIRNDTLYVTDINEIVVIDIKAKKIVDRLPVPGAVFLNDITVDEGGNIYISDTETSKVFLLRDDISVYASGASVAGPNGLLAESDGLIVASASSGDIYFINGESKEISTWANGILSADGVAKDQKNNYFISSWEGQIYYVRKTGEKEKLLSIKASADIDFIKKNKLLLVPTFDGNKVVAYEANYRD